MGRASYHANADTHRALWKCKCGEPDMDKVGELPCLKRNYTCCAKRHPHVAPLHLGLQVALPMMQWAFKTASGRLAAYQHASGSLFYVPILGFLRVEHGGD